MQHFSWHEIRFFTSPLKSGARANSYANRSLRIVNSVPRLRMHTAVR